MSKREKIFAANWKMNKTSSEIESFFIELAKHSTSHLKPFIIAVPSLYLIYIKEIVEKYQLSSLISISAQNVHSSDFGAFTGEISAAMLKSERIPFCILGHSERRSLFAETDQQINLKIKNCLKNKIRPIICIGETLTEREANQTFLVLEKQLISAFLDLTNLDSDQCILAYEPIWAIGTGKTASPEMANEAHSYIRGLILKQFGANTANKLQILYGGSVNSANAKALFGMPDIDGGLVGGASLQVLECLNIIEICNNF